MVFGITGPLDEVRREPPLPFASGPPSDDAHREPAPPATRLRSRDPPERDRPVEARVRARPYGPIGSLGLHLLALLLLLGWPMPAPPEIKPIAVQLVVEPPPPEPKPAPPTPEVKPTPALPPHGRIASEDLGDTEAKAADRANGDAPTPADTPAAPTRTEATPSETPQKTVAVIPPPPAPEKPVQPKDEHVPKPPPKPNPTAHQPPRRAEERVLPVPRRARFPGPAASRDEYLAYLAALARQHLNLLSPAMVGGRRGETVIDVLVLDDGTIAMLRVGRSSGYPDIDVRVEQMIAAVGRFPPLPQWFQGPSMQLEFRLKFPEAFED